MPQRPGNRPPRRPVPPTPVGFALLFALVVAVPGAGPAAAGSGNEIARELRSNQQVLQDFTWKSRAEVKLGGKTKSVQVSAMRYDMDGTLLETPEDPDGSGGKGRSERHAPDPELKSLVEAYTHLTPDTLRELFGNATIAPGDGDDTGLVHVRAEDVRSLGDRVDLWVDRRSHRPLRSEVLTTLDGAAVRIETRFGTVDGGPFFPERTTVHTEVKTRPLVLEIENFGLELQGG